MAAISDRLEGRIMSSPDYKRAISFNLGEAFPDDNPVAAFVVALSLAWKDLVYANLRLVGGDADAPTEGVKQEVSDGEMRYLAGVTFAHLQEMRTCIRQARRKWPEVAEFLDGLSAEAQQDLSLVLEVDTAEHEWIEVALRYLRNQTFHYGGKTNWEDVRWAMRAIKAEEGVISKADDTFRGTRLDFAELIWVQHLTRKFPPAEPDADEDRRQELEEQQMRTLVQALTTAITAGIRFAMAALVAYLNDLPEGVVVWES